MVLPPHPWPSPPPRNHPHFEPAGLARAEVDKQSLNLFFCNNLPLKSAAYKIMAAVVKDDHHALRQLLADPANLPDFANGHGVSPVMVAAARGNIMTLEILAQHPLVNLQRETPAGWTALHYAAHLHQAEAVTSLLKHYADYTRRNQFGETPFDLAKGGKMQEAFWQHKDFARYMKKLKPDHPRFQPLEAPPAAAEEKEAPQLPEKDTLRLDFIASAARLALTQQGMVRYTVTKEIIKQLESITPEDFMSCCRTLRDIENDTPQAPRGFDWDSLFVETAKTGRVELIAPLAKLAAIEDSETLDKALYHCIRVKDAPDAVAVLLQLGADPTTKAPAAFMSNNKDNIIAFKAFEARRPEAFRQICLWTDNLPHWKKSKERLQAAMRMWLGRTFQVNDPEGTAQLKYKMDAAIELQDLRQNYSGIAPHTLHVLMDASLKVGNTIDVVALYAESRVSRLLRGTVTFTKNKEAYILAATLSAGDTVTAKRMVADGCHLKHATDPAALQIIDELKAGKHGDAAKAFTIAHLDGSLKVPEVETPADRMRALADIAARTPTITGRGGFF